jgi:hypothetical protein
MIELRSKHYDQLRNQCDSNSPEFRLLLNACLEPVGLPTERTVQIICDEEEAVLLHDLANRICPAAAHAIKRALVSRGPKQ